MNSVAVHFNGQTYTVDKSTLQKFPAFTAKISALLTATAPLQVSYLNAADKSWVLISGQAELTNWLSFGNSSELYVSTTSAASPHHASAHVDSMSLLKQITETHERVSKQIVEWFLRAMPDAYFREIDSETRLDHLRAIISLQIAGQRLEISLVNRNRGNCTFIKPRNYVGLLREVISELPKDRLLREANIYTSVDEDLVIDVFEFDDGDALKTPFRPQQNKDRLAEILSLSGDANVDHVKEYVCACAEHYTLTTSVSEILRHFSLVDASFTTCDISVELQNMNSADKEPTSVFAMDSPSVPETSQPSRVIVSVPSHLQNDIFSRIVNHFGRLNVDILKATLSRVEKYRGIDFLILTFQVRLVSGAPLLPEFLISKQLCSDVARLPYLDDSITQCIDRYPTIGTLLRAEIAVALSKFAYCLLAEERPLVFTQYHIDQFITENLEIMISILDLWDFKFTPSKTAAAARVHQTQETIAEIRGYIEKQVELEECRQFFHVILNIVMLTLKTNAFMPSRLGLMLRVNPLIMMDTDSFKNVAFDKEKLDLPYGTFYCFGRGFHGFHLRFRDIARGGMRLTQASSNEEFSVFNRGLLMECYFGAIAQHWKNKDIPEGGAKAIILVEPPRPGAVVLSSSADNAIKAFTDCILDLTCFKDSVVDYSTESEVIYLGPDDTISESLIVWICQRAVLRKHPFPSAFMSSKPGAGISHKHYGVIAEGIAVYLDVALRQLNMRHSFTVKISGGPREEVSGSLMRLLIHFFGARARIVAISDVGGVAEDPQGLDHVELQRLLDNDLPIAQFSKAKLSSKGHIIAVSDSNNSGIKARNSMPFRVKSDVFIPAGSARPYTINDKNWQKFLSGDSHRPTSSLVIEGANLFFSSGARTCLSANGALIVPDSCATKCGVICSSYEILAGMLLSEAEFLSIKEKYVSEIIDRLRHFARLEAEIIFKECRLLKKPLIEISASISKTIIGLKDAIYESGYLDLYSGPFVDPSSRKSPTMFQRSFFIESPPANATSDEDKPHMLKYVPEHHKLCRELLIEYIPPSLRLVGGSRIDDGVPNGYKKRILCTAIACKIIYKEGSKFFDEMVFSQAHSRRPSSGNLLELKDDSKSDSNRKITEFAFKYLVEFEKTRELVRRIKMVPGLDTETKDKVVKVLEQGGTRIGVELEDSYTSDHHLG